MRLSVSADLIHGDAATGSLRVRLAGDVFHFNAAAQGLHAYARHLFRHHHVELGAELSAALPWPIRFDDDHIVAPRDRNHKILHVTTRGVFPAAAHALLDDVSDVRL